MTSSGKSVQPTVPGIITMELPQIEIISEAISLLQYRHAFVMPRFLCRVKKLPKMLTSAICYILIRSFSTPFSDSKIDIIALLRASQMSHLIPSIPEIPITHEQSFISIVLSLLDSLESPQL